MSPIGTAGPNNPYIPPLDFINGVGDVAFGNIALSAPTIEVGDILIALGYVSSPGTANIEPDTDGFSWTTLGNSGAGEESGISWVFGLIATTIVTEQDNFQFAISNSPQYYFSMIMLQYRYLGLGASVTPWSSVGFGLYYVGSQAPGGVFTAEWDQTLYNSTVLVWYGAGAGNEFNGTVTTPPPDFTQREAASSGGEAYLTVYDQVLSAAAGSGSASATLDDGSCLQGAVGALVLRK